MAKKHTVTEGLIKGLEGKGNIMGETESLLIAVQKKNAILANYIKAKIGCTQQYSKSSLWGNRDKAVNQIIRECNKLAQKHMTRHD